MLADRAARLADFLDDDGRRALAIAARNIAGELEQLARDLHRTHLRRAA